MSLTDSYPPPRTRSRGPPAPLRLESGPFAPHPTRLPSTATLSSSHSNTSDAHPPAPKPYLYTVPSTSHSPPRSPPYSARPLLSPTRSGFGGPHSPPPFTRPPQRASPPPLTEDVEAFEKQCRDFFYRQNEASAKQIQTTLSSLPASQRARFTRIQASIRAQFHADRTLALQSSLLALLSSTLPSHSLTPASRSKPHSKHARKEREEKLAAFLRVWGTREAVPGAKKFCEALYGVLRAMALPEIVGGAGGRRVEWELDDAVFMESAGEEFMNESVTILKGVLGFSDSIPSSHSLASLASEDDPLPHPPLMGRSRSFSDPFTDPGTPSLSSSPNPSSPLHPASLSLAPLPPTLCHARRWLSPAELTNPIVARLLGLFPKHISRAIPVPRLPGAGDDIEVLAGAGPESFVPLSTGRLRMTAQPRDEGWKGGVWERVKEWFRRVCGM